LLIFQLILKVLQLNFSSGVLGILKAIVAIKHMMGCNHFLAESGLQSKHYGGNVLYRQALKL
jgi:hypothetical protein